MLRKIGKVTNEAFEAAIWPETGRSGRGGKDREQGRSRACGRFCAMQDAIGRRRRGFGPRPAIPWFSAITGASATFFSFIKCWALAAVSRFHPRDASPDLAGGLAAPAARRLSAVIPPIPGLGRVGRLFPSPYTCACRYTRGWYPLAHTRETGKYPSYSS